MEPGLGPLAGTAWVLSAPKGTANNLKVLSTRQDQASKAALEGATEQQSTHARTCVPVLTCILAQLHTGRMAPASLAFPAHVQIPGAGVVSHALWCPRTSCTHLLSSPSPLHLRAADASVGQG